MTAPAPQKSGKGRMVAVAAVVIIIVVIIAGYYVFSGMYTTSPSKVQVTIASGTSVQSNNLNFNPASITVVVGTNNTIVFVNNDNTLHTVAFTSAPTGVTLPAGDSNLAAGNSYTVTLTAPGTYQYHCTIHAWMQGTIIVKSA